jgi:hypothetical protein
MSLKEKKGVTNHNNKGLHQRETQNPSLDMCQPAQVIIQLTHLPRQVTSNRIKALDGKNK